VILPSGQSSAFFIGKRLSFGNHTSDIFYQVLLNIVETYDLQLNGNLRDIYKFCDPS